MKLTENINFPLSDAVLKKYSNNRDEFEPKGLTHSSDARREGIELFKKLGLPTTKLEKWRSTNLNEFYEKELKIGYEKPAFDKEINEIFHCSVHGFNTNVFSLLNGWFYSPEDKQLQVLEDGIIIGSMSKAQKEYPDIFQKYYNRQKISQGHGLNALNSAIYTDGLFVYVPDNVRSEKAIQLIKMVNSDTGSMINTRNLIIIGNNCKISFLHCDDSINQNTGFLVTNSEIFLGENSELDLYKLQNLNNQTALLNSTSVYQQKSSDLNIKVLSFNGGIIRNEFLIDLQGEFANGDIAGMYLMDENQHIDNQVKVLHSAPNCTSSELFKGVLDNKASAVFNGYIYVARDAQKTQAFQRNANILMTSEAKIDTMPFLEIYADDVKCSHGATVGQLDEEALFYMMQRGISEANARLLLMYAFVNEVTDKIAIEPLRSSIDDMVKKRLRGDLSICDRCVLHCSKPDKPMEFEIDMSKI